MHIPKFNVNLLNGLCNLWPLPIHFKKTFKYCYQLICKEVIPKVRFKPWVTTKAEIQKSANYIILQVFCSTIG